MKNLFKLMTLAIAVMAVFSCAKEIDNKIEEDPVVPVETKTVTLTANVDANPADVVGTKTYLDGVDILWSGTETVRAYGTLNYDAAIATLTPNKKVATFDFEVDPGDEIHYGIYPAANAGDTDETAMTVTIPAVQTATAGSFDPLAMAAIGRVLDGGNIGFKNVGALLSIVINNDDIKSVELSATEASGYSMTGTALIEINGSDEISTVTDGSSTSVKLSGGLDNGETYYFVVYPGEYSNLRIVVTDNDDAIAVYRNKTPFTVGRNQNWKIAELNIPAGKWEPVEVETRAFYESFNDCNGTGGNDDQWSGSIASSAWDTSVADNDGWTKSGNAYKAKECLRIGKVGSVTTPALGITDASVDLSFKAAAWNSSTEKTTMKVSVVGTGKIKVGGTEYTEYSFDIEKGSWSTLGAKITGANSLTKLTFSSQGSDNDRFFLDEVEILTVAARDDTPVHYTVTYDANTGSGDAPTDGSDYNNQTNFIVTVAGQGELTKTGHTFNGWNTAADGTGTAYAAGATFIIKSDVTLYAQWTPIVYTITKNVNSHGTYTVKDSGNNEVTTATYGTSLTLTADTPDAGYAFEKFVINYTKEDSTPGVSNFTQNPKPYSMPASNIEITLVLSETTTYDVTLMYNGAEHSVVPVSEGASILEAISSVGSTLIPPTDKSFLGWSTSSDPASVSLITSSTLASSSITLYAVFGSAAKYVLVESNLANWAGDYLIAYNDDTFMDGSLPGGKNSGQVGYGGTAVDPNTALSANKKEVTSAWGDGHYLTLETCTNGYVLKTHSATTPYIYQTSNSNGMASTATKATAANYPITVTFTSASDIKLGLGGAAAGAVLRYNTGSDMFRYYKDGGQEAVYLYKKQLGETIITW